MDLISCVRCGTVLDKNRIIEPNAYMTDPCDYNKKIGAHRSIWDKEIGDYVATINCPCCETIIKYYNGDVG